MGIIRNLKNDSFNAIINAYQASANNPFITPLEILNAPGLDINSETGFVPVYYDDAGVVKKRKIDIESFNKDLAIGDLVEASASNYVLKTDSNKKLEISSIINEGSKTSINESSMEGLLTIGANGLGTSADSLLTIDSALDKSAFRFLGNHKFEVYGTQHSTVGNKTVIGSFTSYDAGLEMTSSNSITAGIRFDMSSGNNYYRGLNIYNPGIIGGASAKINFTIGEISPAYGEGTGFNWFQSTNPHSLTKDKLLMSLGTDKGLAFYDTNGHNEDAFSQYTNAFRMYSVKSTIGEETFSHPMILKSNGIKLYLGNLDWDNINSFDDLKAEMMSSGF